MTLSATIARHLRRGLLGVAACAALVACGGGTSTFEPFVPQRLFAFGDESSLLSADGRKHSVNALDATDAIDCTALPLWTQVVATGYRFVFPECNPNNVVAAPQARQYAAVGAKADDLKAQIDQRLADGSIADTDVVTVMFGVNDVLELYARSPATPSAELVAEARARGVRLAQQVNRLVDLGARVVLSTAVDVGLTPFGVAAGGAGRQLLTDLSTALNSGLRTTIVQDGRHIGLVLADEMVQAAAANPGLQGFTDVTNPLCTTALPDCTTKTLVSGSAHTTWLWADPTHLGSAGQLRLGQIADNRAHSNPF